MSSETPKERLYRTLKSRIVRGVYGGGVQLRQCDLAREFGVSRIPVREVLIRLDGEGLVEVLPHKGATVAPLSAQEAQELFELRFVLESAALRFALERMTPEDFRSVETFLDRVARDPDPRSRSEKNRNFHLVLWGFCGRRRLLSLIDSLLLSLDRYIRVYLRLMGYQEDSTKAHRELFLACRDDTPDRAAELLRRHLEEASQRICGFLASL